MVKPSEGGQDSHTYQQALDDFSITQLLSRISNYSDAEEQEIGSKKINSHNSIFVNLFPVSIVPL